MFRSSSTSGIPAVSMELSRDLMVRMHDSAMCTGQSSLVVDYSVTSAAAATTPFYSYAGKSSPAAGTSCSSGDEESCGSGGSLRVTTAAADYTEALRCRYGDEMLTETGGTPAASSERQQAALSLGRRNDAGSGVDVDISADYDDENDERQRHSSSTPGTHRKHKAQKQVLSLFYLLYVVISVVLSESEALDFIFVL